MGDLYSLPAEILNVIRGVVTGGLPVRLEAPAQVSLFVYDNIKFIVESGVMQFLTIHNEHHIFFT